MNQSKVVRYSSNNSGGAWWLIDEDWYALENAGWEVNWLKEDSYYIDSVDPEGRWLGALATSATRSGLSLSEATDEFERITGATACEEGCPCCGQPHNFYEEDKGET